MMTEYKVSAIVNDENAPYHRFLKKRELKLQRCSGCGYVRYPIRWICPECLSEKYEWQAVSGAARVETFIWYFKDVLDPRYTNDWSYRDVPYNVAIVKLPEGPRILTNIVDMKFGELKMGQPVTPFFVDISDDFAILRFKPRGPDA